MERVLGRKIESSPESFPVVLQQNTDTEEGADHLVAEVSHT